jgi:hypothetical protein
MANQLKTKFIGNDQVVSEKILLENNSALRSKDAAGSGEVELIKVNSSDEVVVTNLVAPSSDDDAATKKYVDDTVAGGGAALTNHLNDSEDAHDASAISVIPTGNLAASDVQAALQELQGDLDGIAATYVDVAGDTMTGNLLVTNGVSTSTLESFRLSGSAGMEIAGNPVTLNSDNGNASLSITASEIHIGTDKKIKSQLSAEGSLSFNTANGSVDIQGNNSDVNIDSAANIKLNSVVIENDDEIKANKLSGIGIASASLTFSGASNDIATFGAQTISIAAAQDLNLTSAVSASMDVNSGSGTFDFLCSVDMNTKNIDNLPIPSSNGQPLVYDQLGSANGVAPLNGSSKIESQYLPSYVDDVIEFADLTAIQNQPTPEMGVIYVALDNGKVYRWTGSIYVEISPSEVISVNSLTGIVSLTTDEIPEGSTNLYFNGKDTDDLPEGSTNLYFTETRAKTAAVFNGITDGVTDVAPSQDAVHDALALKLNTADFGTEFDSDFSAKTTDDLSEGSSNLYFTETRAKTAAVSDVAYGAGWDNVLDVAPSKNAVYDQMELERARIQALEDISPEIFKKTLDATDITNKYIDLSHEAVDTKDFHVFVDRLAMHQDLSWVSGDTTPAGEDYRLSVVGGVTRIHFLNDMVSPGGQQLSSGDNIYVRYKRSL